MRRSSMIDIAYFDAAFELERSMAGNGEWTIVCLGCLRVHRAGEWTEERAISAGGHSTGFCDECARARRSQLTAALPHFGRATQRS
jgi:hypothetical protein